MSEEGATFRFTITVTPMTPSELQDVIDDIRRRFGRKHLVHIVGEQPSDTPLSQTSLTPIAGVQR